MTDREILLMAFDRMDLPWRRAEPREIDDYLQDADVASEMFRQPPRGVFVGTSLFLFNSRGRFALLLTNAESDHTAPGVERRRED